jgi:hypothetical protein
MKIHIHDEKESCIEGCLSITYNSLEKLNDVIDNSCDYIFANNIFDKFLIENFDSVLNLITQKLRLNGTLIVSGADIKLISRAIYNDLMDLTQVSTIISDKKSINSALNVIEKLESKNLKIITTKILGYNYEIFCTRQVT